MKLLICTQEYPPYTSGIGNVVYNIAEKMKEKGVKVEICSPVGPDFEIGNFKFMSKTGLIGLIYFWFLISIKFRNESFDNVWLHGNIFFLKNPFKKPLVTLHTTYLGYTKHGISPKIYYFIASFIEKKFLKKIKKSDFTCVSEEVCKEVQEIDSDIKNVIYVPNGVDTKKFKPNNDKNLIREKFNIPKENLVLLSVGRLVRQKNPDKLIKTFAIIEKKMPNVSLVIAGDGDLLKEVKDIIKQENIENVILLGKVNYEIDLPLLYSCSDYYIMFSEYEGQPLTLLEAMSSGLPCIVSDIPNLDLVEKVDCGIKININKKDASTKILRYLKKNNVYQSQNARNYALENLDWERIADTYLNKLIA